MNELLAQAGNLDATWVIGGLSTAFMVFATWAGKFVKQVWTDIKLMHSNQINTLESVIGKQSASTNKIKEQNAQILTETSEIKKLQEEAKFSISAINERLSTL